MPKRNFVSIFKYIFCCHQPQDLVPEVLTQPNQNTIKSSHYRTGNIQDDSTVQENQNFFKINENQFLIYFQEQNNLQKLQTKSLLQQLINIKTTVEQVIFINMISQQPTFFRDHAYYLRQIIDSYDSSTIIFDINYELQERLYGQFLKINTPHNLILAVQLIENNNSKSKLSIFESPSKQKKSSSLIKQSYDNIPRNHNNEVFEVLFIGEEFPFKPYTLKRIDYIFVIPFNLDKSDFLIVKKEYLNESQKKLVLDLLRNYLEVLDKVILVFPPFINLSDIIHILQIFQYIRHKSNKYHKTSFTLESILSQQSKKLELILIKFNQLTQRQISTKITNLFFQNIVPHEETLLKLIEELDVEECLQLLQKMKKKFKQKQIVALEDKIALIQIFKEIKIQNKLLIELNQQLLPNSENSLKRVLSSIKIPEIPSKHQKEEDQFESEFTYESLPNSQHSQNYLNQQLFSQISSTNEQLILKRLESNKIQHPDQQK